jgi:hypothetical protein
MMGVRVCLLALSMVALGAVSSMAQNADSGPAWSASANLITYVLPDEGNYAQPTVTLDRKWLHVEGRLNYEAMNTASLWAGYNLAGGSAVAWELTPMVGAAFGDVGGVAPGYVASIAWWKLDFYSEGEYLFDLSRSADSFLYNWSELALAPAAWLRVGLVTERTRVRATAREIQRGPFIGITFRRLECAAYLLDARHGAPTMALSVGWNFGSD